MHTGVLFATILVMFTNAPDRASLVRRQGFTIVELLIVVVVIAILAAITIVAYNGIQNRAKASAAQEAAKQTYTKILTYAVDNADTYPASLAALNITNSDSTTYQYSVDNAASPRTFCLTATTSNVSYYISQAVITPTVGACAGHGVNGTPAVTNLARNPRAVSTGAAYTNQTPTGSIANFQPTAGPDGGSAFQVVTTQVGQIRIRIPDAIGNVNAGDVIGLRADVYAPVATQLQLELGVNGVFPKSTGINVNAGWNTITGTVTVPSSGSIGLVQLLGVSTTIPADSTWRVTRVMLVRSSSIPQYADGNSSNWLWTGAAHDSTSYGPPTY